MLTARDLTVTLARRDILHRIDFTARAGQITAIVGPNGSGKTTLMRALTGEHTPRLGRITLAGEDIARLTPRALARRRAVLEQAATLGFAFSLREVVSMGVEAGHAAHLPDLAEQALAEVGLAHRIDGWFSHLSGGEQARTHLARVRAQVWHPVHEGRASWLMVDEPVAALDIGHQLQVMRLLRRYADDGGGVVAVMHDLNLSAMFADAMVLMENGRILSAGTPAEVMTETRLSTAYGCRICVNRAPETGVWLLPQMAQ